MVARTGRKIDGRSWSRSCGGRCVLARLRSASLFGVEVSFIEVEVDVSFGLPAFNMVGLPDPSVRESRDRVRRAIRNSGFKFPAHRVTVNLAPANVPKRGTSYDLPIAIGVLAASGLLPEREYPDLLLLVNCRSMARSRRPRACCTWRCSPASTQCVS